jgi:CRISPR system Cascade subunit CasC
MKHLELHILQSVPVACLNRDDLNSPKTAIFGGVQRARVSSQCWKSAIRKQAEEFQKEYFGGKRTKLVAAELMNRLKGLSPDVSEALRMAMSHYIGKLDPKNVGKVKTLMFFSPQEFDKLANILSGLEDDDKRKITDSFRRMDKSIDVDEEAGEETEEKNEATKETMKEAKRKQGDEKKVTAKEFMKTVSGVLKQPVGKAFKGKDAIAVKDAADIFLFGRMVANDHSLTVEGTTMFSHALSTHKVDNEIDFFAAVDDLQPKEEAGAGMTGTLEFNSATYYRFAALNLDMLTDKDHLGAKNEAGEEVLTQEERHKIVEAFIKATLMAMPVARKNSMNGNTLPGFVLGVVREKGHPIQLANAFENPVKRTGGKSVFEISRERLIAEYDLLKKTWDLDESERVEMPVTGLNDFVKRVISHVE